MANRKREIELAVLANGLPDRFSHLVVKRLWPKHYRVNVYSFTGEPGVVVRRKIVHSYFVKIIGGKPVFDPILKGGVE